jgi:hypothetical protein
MLRLVRISLATLIVVTGATAIHAALDLEGIVGGLADLGLLIAAMLLASLSDRELFWAAPPRRKRSRRRSRAVV